MERPGHGTNRPALGSSAGWLSSWPVARDNAGHSCRSIPAPVLWAEQARVGGPWIMMRSATDLSKADLHVFSKLFDDGLERGQEAKAFSWRQIGGHDDVLDFFVGHLINVDMTRQPAP